MLTKKVLRRIAPLFLIITPAIAFSQSWNFSSDQPANWQGFYAGPHVGAAFGRGNLSTSVTTDRGGYFSTADLADINNVGSQRYRNTAFNGGVQGGYNFQSNNLVFGIEADFGWMHLRDSQSVTAPYSTTAGTFTIDQSVRTHWLFTARPRIGYTFGNLLAYATGGYALTRLDYDSTFTDTRAAASESASYRKDISGWTVGAGLEYQVDTCWSVRAEYLYADFGHVSTTSNNLDVTITPGLVSPEDTFHHSASLRTHLLNFALNYRF